MYAGAAQLKGAAILAYVEGAAQDATIGAEYLAIVGAVQREEVYAVGAAAQVIGAPTQVAGAAQEIGVAYLAIAGAAYATPVTAGPGTYVKGAPPYPSLALATTMKIASMMN